MNPDGSNFRKYGPLPYQLVLVHGGPGAAGYLTPLARVLSTAVGLIDAYQTKYTIKDLLSELYSIISMHTHKPVVLLGHSWGAWLSLLFAQRYPAEVRKLILVASPPFNKASADQIMQTRLDRLDAVKSRQLIGLMQQIEILPPEKRNDVFLDLATIIREADGYDLTEDGLPETSFSYALYEAVWHEAEQLRSSGELLLKASSVNCPVVAIHGDFDPHPAAGVDPLLKQRIHDYRFILLAKCGHEPWSEKNARDQFIRLILSEL